MPPLAVPPLSITVTVIVAVPLALGRRREGERAGRVGAGVGDRRVGDQARVAAGGGDVQDLRPSPGPAVMPVRLTVCGAAVFSGAIGAGCDRVERGAWLTGMTVTMKVWVTVLMPPLAVPPLSVTVTVIVAVPLALGTGV